MLRQKTLKRMKAMLNQSKIDCESNTDEQAIEVKELYPSWESYAEGHTFKVDDRVLYEANDELYKVLTEHQKQSTWTPDASPSLFVRIAKEEIPEWVQPQGSTDAYMTGDKVKHNGFVWESLVDNNVWEPSDEVPTLWQKEV